MTPVKAEDVLAFLRKLLARSTSADGSGAERLAEDVDLLGAGIIDSLGVIEMIAAVEQHFGIAVDFETIDPADLTVLGPFCRFVADNARASAPSHD